MRNIEGRNPIPRDEGLLKIMSRSNMEDFWGTEQITVGENLKYFRIMRIDAF